MALISFACPACGKVLKSSAAAAGRTVMCPGCQHIVSVPEGTGKAACSTAAGAAALSAKSSLVSLTARTARDDRFDTDDAPRHQFAHEEDLSPRRSIRGLVERPATSPRASNKKLLLYLSGGLLGLLLAALAIAGYHWPGLLLIKPDDADAALALLPADSNLVLGFRLGKVREDPSQKKTLDDLVDKYLNLSPTQREVLQDTETLLVGGKVGAGDFQPTIIFLMARNQELARVRRAFHARGIERIDGHDLHKLPDGILVMPSPRVLVFSKVPEHDLAAQLHQARPVLPADMLGQIQGLRDYSFWMVLALDEQAQEKLQTVDTGMVQLLLANFMPLVHKAKFLTVQVQTDAGPAAATLPIAMSLVCASAGDAKRGEAILRELRQNVQQMPLALALVPNVPLELINAVADDLKKLNIEVAGDTLTATATLSAQTTKELEILAGRGRK